MTRLLWTLGILISAATLDARAQRSFPAPDPAVMAAMEHVKDKCTKDTPCKYKVEDRGHVSLVTVEFTRKESPDAAPKPYPGGRAQLTIDKKGNLLKRVDGE
jgi:hypothetical protein